MTPRLQLRDVIVRRGDREVLAVPDLAVEPGEVLAVVGPNGAGKSTLLQAAALLLKPQSGAIIIDGERAVPGNELALRRRMAVSMQDAMLIGGSTLDNAGLGLKLRRVPRPAREATALGWLRRFGVAALAARPASRLSGGEAQRVSLARAFAIDPYLLFLDEPFSGLDEPTRHALLDDLSLVLRETGVTAVFVTHDRDEALHLANRVAVIIGGGLRQAGEPQDVFGAPADEEVAAFIGVENIIRGRVIQFAEGLAFVDVGGRTVVGLAQPGLRDDVRVCLRPENVTLRLAAEPGDAGSARNSLPGTVIEVRPRGAEARLLIDCGFPLAVLVTRMSVAELGLGPGTSVVASFKATAVHLLPAG